MTDALRVGVAGLGTVGAAVVKLLNEHGELLASRAGRAINVTAVSARDRKKDRGIDLSSMTWHDDATDLAGNDQVDVVVELIGGADGPAKALAEAALRSGKPVVTGNKALIANHGTELARLAEANAASLHFESAVAGGIPVIKAIRESLVGNQITQIYGILNGTCNYILTMMEETGCEFAEALKVAQELGYAEADPTFDVDGIDAAHKLAILSALAFGTVIDFESVAVEGVSRIGLEDIEIAAELGMRIKHLGIARQTKDGVAQFAYPAMIPLASAIAPIDGATNAVVVDGDYVGRAVFEGPGAGAGPTASAVVSDLVDLARGIQLPAFGVAVDELRQASQIPVGQRQGSYYVRLQVRDVPGVMADVTAIFKAGSISLESIIQRHRANGGEDTVPVVMVTHEANETAMMKALSLIEALEVVVDQPIMIRIEDL